jgi:hypothetical protein
MMPLSVIALEGFLAAIGAISAVFILVTAAHLYNEKMRNESFETAIDSMSKSTVIAVESIKDTTVTAINALLNMDAVGDVNDLARTKQGENNSGQPAQK